MNCNVGPNERVARIAIGLGTVGTALFWKGAGWWRIPMAALGVSEAVTGVIRYCPVNDLLGIDNCAGMDQVKDAAKSGVLRTAAKAAGKLVGVGS